MAGLGTLTGAAWGFALCFGVAAVADLAIGRPNRIGGPVGDRQFQWRRMMVLSMGRLMSDAMGMLLVFFILPGEWALIGGALGLLSWRAIWLVFATRQAARQDGGPVARTQTGGSEGAVS